MVCKYTTILKVHIFGAIFNQALAYVDGFSSEYNEVKATAADFLVELKKSESTKLCCSTTEAAQRGHPAQCLDLSRALSKSYRHGSDYVL